jgi:two-component system, NarL family, sensor histidine kinase UhpB
VDESLARCKTWGPHVAIAGAYAACYEVARHVSFSHWMVTAGLRLACLLLMPRRYWVALAVGEGLPVAEQALLCAPQFGTAWAMSAAVPIMLPCMACIGPMRRRGTLVGADGDMHMGFVLAATLACSCITAVVTSLTLEVALLDGSGHWGGISATTYFWAYLLGAYLGALTLTPTLLTLHQHVRQYRRLSVALMWRSLLPRHTVLYAAPVVMALALVSTSALDDRTREAARLMMCLPVIVLAWRHGWQGAALGGMTASIALAATGGPLLDAPVIQAQVVLALVISTSLLVGARLARTRRLRASSVPGAGRIGTGT